MQLTMCLGLLSYVIKKSIISFIEFKGYTSFISCIKSALDFSYYSLIITGIFTQFLELER